MEVLIYNQQPDIIAVNEVFPKNQQTDPCKESYLLQGFQAIWNERFFCKGNRGSVIFVKDGIDVTMHKQLNNLSPKEEVWCEINITNNKKVLVGLVYRSPNSTENNNLLLNDLIKQLKIIPLLTKL